MSSSPSPPRRAEGTAPSEEKRSPSTVLSAGEAATAPTSRIGGKARGLARLEETGARVPRWFVVPTDALERHLADHGLTSGVAQALDRLRALPPLDPGTLEELGSVSAELRGGIEGAELDGALSRSVRDALASLGPGPYAVRSSMVGEDSQTRSFAGQLDSFLFQRDAAQVLDSIRRCWSSALSSRALSYQLRSPQPLGPPRVAVVVQEMIDGRVSGVLFTANPIDGRRDRSLLTACWGSGEGVVSGLCDTDEYVWSDDEVELSVRIADKTQQVRARSDSLPGTAACDVSSDLRSVRCLSAEEAAAICREGRRIAEAFQAPQDIEWTLDGDRLYLLQARPITSMPPPPPPDAPRVVWDNSNIQESFCGVTTPLTFSFALDAYANVYEQTMRALGIPERTIQEHRPVLRRMLGLVRGRVFYNINNWYRALLLLPSFGRNKADMEKMMGLDSPVDFIEDQVLSRWEKARRLPRMLWTLARLQGKFVRLPRLVPRFLAETDAVFARIDRPALAGRGISELLATGEMLLDDVFRRWHTPIVNDFYVMTSTGRLRRLVERATGREEVPRFLAILLGGEEGIASAEPARILMRLAREAHLDGRLASALSEGTAAEVTARLERDFPAFRDRLRHYLDRYGDRCIGELKLETISLREDPSFVIEVLRRYIERPELDPDRMAEDELRTRRAAEAELERELRWWNRRRFRSALRAARRGIEWRESMRLQRTRVFGLFRDIYRAIGERLHEAGRLENARDVFYLTVEEIASYHDGTAASANLAALASVRKEEYASYAGVEAPNRLETLGPVYHGNDLGVSDPSEEERGKRVLRGIGCSPGVVESSLSIVLDPRDARAIGGKVLTTLRTDPGWAPLFPLASGILVERGSNLSHSAVLARELGIPAVVSVPGLLKIVVDGEPVRLDGGAGVVERLSPP